MNKTMTYIFKAINRLIRKIGLTITFSSDGEDLILNKILGGIKNGNYIDIGSNHPVRHSNTFNFYLNNWSGICIDPLPGLKRKYKVFRSRDLFLNVGIVKKSTTDQMTFYYYKQNPDNSTFDKKRVVDLKNLYNRIPSKELKVDLISIDELSKTKKFIEFNSTIHLFNLDIEGFEKEILSSFFSDKKFPWIVCVEELGFLTENINKSKINILMKKNNYVLGMRTFLSSIYIYRPIISKLESPFVNELKLKNENNPHKYL